MKPQLNLFAILEFLDLKSFQVREAVDTPEELKELDRNAGWLLPQWMTGAMSEKDHAMMIERFNDSCNTGWNSLQKHPELQLKMLAAIGLGRKVKHRFFKPASNPQSDKMMEFIRTFLPDVKLDEVRHWVGRVTEDQFVELISQSGVQAEEQAEIVKSFKSARGAG